MDPSRRVQPQKGIGTPSKSPELPPATQPLADKVNQLFQKASPSQMDFQPSNPKLLMRDQVMHTIEKEVNMHIDSMLPEIADVLVNPVTLGTPTKAEMVSYVDKVGREGVIQFKEVTKIDYGFEAKLLKNLARFNLTVDDKGVYLNITDNKEPLTEEEEKNNGFINLEDQAIFCKEEIKEETKLALREGRIAVDESASEELKAYMRDFDFGAEITIVVFEDSDEDWNQLVSAFIETVIDFDALVEARLEAQSVPMQKKGLVQREVDEEEIEEGKASQKAREPLGETPIETDAEQLEETIKNFLLENQLQRKIAEIIQNKLNKWMESLNENEKLALKDEEVRAKLREFILHDLELRTEVKRSVMQELLKKLSIKHTRGRVQVLDRDTKAKLNIRKIHYRGEDSFYQFEISKSRMGAGVTGKDIIQLEKDSS